MSWGELAKYIIQAGGKKLMGFFTAGTVGYEIAKINSVPDDQKTYVNTAVVKAIENNNTNTNSDIKIILIIFVALAILCVIAWGIKIFSNAKSANRREEFELRTNQHNCSGSSNV